MSSSRSSPSGARTMCSRFDWSWTGSYGSDLPDTPPGTRPQYRVPGRGVFGGGTPPAPRGTEVEHDFASKRRLIGACCVLDALRTPKRLRSSVRPTTSVGPPIRVFPHIVRPRVARPLGVAGSQLSPHAVTTLTTGSAVGTRPVSTDPATARRGRCPLIVIAMTPTNRQRAHPGIRIAGDGDTRGQRHPEWVSTDTPLDNPIPIGNQLGTAHLWGEAASERQLGRLGTPGH